MPRIMSNLSNSYRIEHSGIEKYRGEWGIQFTIQLLDNKRKSIFIIFTDEFLSDGRYLPVNSNKELLERFGLVRIEELLDKDNIVNTITISRSDSEWANRIQEKNNLVPSSEQQSDGSFLYASKIKIGF